MTWSDGLHSKYFDLGMTDKKREPSGTRARIKVYTRFEVRGGCLVNVVSLQLKLGRGYGKSASIADVDALIDRLDAKRHARWRMAREAIAPYLGGLLCPHQTLGGLSEEQRVRMQGLHKVRYCTLNREMSYKRSELGGVLLKRLVDDGKAWVTDEERKLACLPSELYLVDEKYPTEKVPDGMDVLNDSAYTKYGVTVVPYFQMPVKAQKAVLEEERADLTCPICGHNAGNVYTPVRVVTDFNEGQRLLDFCEHGCNFDYGWRD